MPFDFIDVGGRESEVSSKRSGSVVGISGLNLAGNAAKLLVLNEK